jgi:hypothetical protein
LATLTSSKALSERLSTARAAAPAVASPQLQVGDDASVLQVGEAVGLVRGEGSAEGVAVE